MTHIMRGLGSVPIAPPTRKQLRVIRYIEDNLNNKFQGKSFDDAAAFINANMFQSECSRRRELKSRNERSHGRRSNIYYGGGGDGNGNGEHDDYDTGSREWDTYYSHDD
jgi:hypothetical protein